METPTFFLAKLLKVFVHYFNETSQAIVDLVRANSRDASGESALDALKYEVTRTLDGSSKGNKRVKLGKQIDILVDNVRIFACFIADLTIYFYNLDQLAFECQTATQDWVTIIDNPFLSRDVIANYYIDWLFDRQRSEKLLEIIRHESRDPNDVLSTNIALLLKKASWKSIGMPAEILDYARVKTPVHSQMDSILSDQHLVEQPQEYVPTPPAFPKHTSYDAAEVAAPKSPVKFTRTSMPSQAFGSVKQHADESFDQDDFREMFGGEKDLVSTTPISEVGTSATACPPEVAKEPVNQTETEVGPTASSPKEQSKHDEEGDMGASASKTASEPDFETTLMFEEGLDRIKDGAGLMNQSSLSMFMDCTSIQGISHFGIPHGDGGYESTANDTQGGLLHLLNQREATYTKQLFPEAIELFKQLPKSQNPCRKLYIFASAMATALKEMRKVYSEITPTVETKVKVQMQDLLAVLIYIIAQANIPDLVTEYKVMKVYFLLNREYNHTLLVSLLKSAVKSINKVGVFLTKTMAH